MLPSGFVPFGQACGSMPAFDNLAPSNARNFMSELLRFVEVPRVSTSDAVRALQFPMRDIEDALQASAALAFNASFIVTRNAKDYLRSPGTRSRISPIWRHPMPEIL